jgi:hypothetical protein
MIRQGLIAPIPILTDFVNDNYELQKQQQSMAICATGESKHCRTTTRHQHDDRNLGAYGPRRSSPIREDSSPRQGLISVDAA